MQLHWHRRDLRVGDNRALAAAAEDGTVCPVFVFDDAVLDHAAPPRVGFMLDALAALRSRYRELGSDLLIARGDPREVLPEIADALDAEQIHEWTEPPDASGSESLRSTRSRSSTTPSGANWRSRRSRRPVTTVDLPT